MRSLRANVLCAVFASLCLASVCESTVASELDFEAELPSEDEGLEELERLARTTPQTGDLDAIAERGYIRVLVPYNQTFFFYEGARPRGLAVEFMEAFAKSHPVVRNGRQTPLTVLFLPTSRDRMIPGIVEGLGDVAFGGLTATEDRLSVVDFVTHSKTRVSEVIVTGPGAPELRSLEDLSGQRIFVRESSSHHESLRALDARLRAEGRKPLKIVSAEEDLEIEDILELVRSDVESITVADDYLAHFWIDVMGGLTVRDDLVVREAATFGPVIRKNSPELTATLRKFMKSHGIGTTFGNVVKHRYLKANPWVRNPNASADRRRFEQTLPLFQKYGAQYSFDVLLLAAQAYQESGLDQSVRSHAGAVGVMQIKPSTAAGNPIRISGVEVDIDNNVHAGAKYLRHLIDQYFDDPEMTTFNRHVFAIAAYNAGPSRVRSMRQKASAQGLDPNVWFNNVELVSARVLGRENVTYVRNILKYWVAYRVAADRLIESPEKSAPTRSTDGSQRGGPG